MMDVKIRGFDKVLVLDTIGNTTDNGSFNICMVKNSLVFRLAPNGTFLSSITRTRTMKLLADKGMTVIKGTLSVRKFLEADEIFSTGNHSKVVPITSIEERILQSSLVAKKESRASYIRGGPTRMVQPVVNVLDACTSHLVSHADGNLSLPDTGLSRISTKRVRTMTTRIALRLQGVAALHVEGDIRVSRRRHWEHHHDKRHKAYTDNGNKLPEGLQKAIDSDLG